MLTLLINLSLSAGEFTTALKTALVTPLLKKYDLDSEILKNFRPVSNLKFISKLIERAACNFLKQHLEANNLNARF